MPRRTKMDTLFNNETRDNRFTDYVRVIAYPLLRGQLSTFHRGT